MQIAKEIAKEKDMNNVASMAQMKSNTNYHAMKSCTARTALVTPEMAEKWLSFSVFEKQRNLRYQWINFLADEIIADRFLPFLSIYFVKYKDGSRVLVDGQHRLSAVVKANKSVPMTIIEYLGDSNFAKVVYTALDMNSRRTKNDKIKVWLEAGTKQGEFSKTVLARSMSGLSIVARGFMEDGKNFSEKVLYDNLPNWSDCIQQLDSILDGLESDIVQPIRRAPVTAIALATLKFSHHGYDFWYQVANDDGLRKGDIRKKLHHFFRESKMLGRGVKRTVNNRDMLTTVAHCWNKYVENAPSMKFIRIPKTRTVVISDTPFDSKLSSRKYRTMFENHSYDFPEVL